MRYTNSKLLVVLILLFGITACGGGSDTTELPPLPPSANVPPTSNAGADQNVDEQSAVALSGSGTDSDGSIASYSWTQTSGTTVTISGADSTTPSFDTPVTTTQLTLTFQLTVTDNDGATANDTVDVIVTPVNATPTADAGTDKTIPEGSFVNLTGNGSDIDGSITGGVWSQVSGTTVSISTPTQLTTGVTISSGLQGETLVFRLEITDNEGGTATDELTITVEPAVVFVDYTGDIDPEPLDNVSIDVVDMGTTSLIPASNAANGYTTFMINSTGTYNFTIANDTLTLTGTGEPVIMVGDIIVGVTADETAGYAREVIAINGTVYSTIPAKLNEAFPNADVSLDITISNNTITTTSQVKTGGDNITQKSSQVDILSFNRTMEYEISPDVKTVTILSMNSAFNVSLDFSIFSGTITKLSSIVSADYSTTAYLDVNLTQEYAKSVEKEFKPIFDKSKVIFLHGFPVLVNVKAVPMIGAGIEMSTAGTLKYGFKVGGAVRAGFEYEDSVMTNIAEFTPIMTRIGPEYTLAGGLKLDAQSSIAVIVTLYEIEIDIPLIGEIEFSGPGTSIDLGPYAKFTVDAKYDSTADPSLTCALDLSVGIKSDLNIDYGTLGSQLSIDNPDAINLYTLNKSLWNSDVCPFDPAVGNLMGVITDSSDMPMNGVVVQVKNDLSEIVAETSSSSMGLYELNEIAIGAYEVFYSKQDYKEAYSSLVIIENETIERPVTLVKEGEGTLRISVVNDIAPTVLIADVTIVIREGLNNPTGAFVRREYSTDTPIDIILDAGYYTLEIVEDGYPTVLESISIENEQVEDKTISLTAENSNCTSSLLQHCGVCSSPIPNKYNYKSTIWLYESISTGYALAGGDSAEEYSSGATLPISIELAPFIETSYASTSVKFSVPATGNIVFSSELSNHTSTFILGNYNKYDYDLASTSVEQEYDSYPYNNYPLSVILQPVSPDIPKFTGVAKVLFKYDYTPELDCSNKDYHQVARLWVSITSESESVEPIPWYDSCWDSRSPSLPIGIWLTFTDGISEGFTMFHDVALSSTAGRDSKVSVKVALDQVTGIPPGYVANLNRCTAQ